MSVLVPVVELGGELVVVSGAMPAGQLTAFVAQLAEQARPEGLDVRSAAADEALSWIVAAARDGAILVGGGLRAEDEAGFRVDPGCCCDLNDWRDWTGLDDRAGFWLGHSPDPWVEYLESSIRVHGAQASAAGWVEFPNEEIPALLGAVQQHLLGFLDAMTGWTTTNAPGSETHFRATLDQILTITPPLPWAQS